jgi:hypothetical protein
LAVELECFHKLLLVHPEKSIVIVLLAVAVTVVLLIAHVESTRSLVSHLKKKHSLACPLCGQLCFGKKQQQLFETGRCVYCGSIMFTK